MEPFARDLKKIFIQNYCVETDEVDVVNNHIVRFMTKVKGRYNQEFTNVNSTPKQHFHTT